MDEKPPYELFIYFVPRSKIKRAIAAMHQNYNFGFSWVKSCEYLPTEDCYSVLVAMTASYPYLEKEFGSWEMKDNRAFDGTGYMD